MLASLLVVPPARMWRGMSTTEEFTVTDGLHFRFCETAPDIRMCRLAERNLETLRARHGYPFPCVVRVSETHEAPRPARFHVRVDCDFGRARGFLRADAYGEHGLEALERAFRRMRVQSEITVRAERSDTLHAVGS